MNQLPDVLVVVRQPCLWPPEQQHLVLSAPNIGQQKDLLVIFFDTTNLF